MPLRTTTTMAVKQGRRAGSGFWIFWKVTLFFALICGLLFSSEASHYTNLDCDAVKKLTHKELADALHLSYPVEAANGTPYNDGVNCINGLKPKELSKEQKVFYANMAAQGVKPRVAPNKEDCGLEDLYKKAFTRIAESYGKNCKSKKCVVHEIYAQLICRSSSNQVMFLTVVLAIGVGLWVQ